MNLLPGLRELRAPLASGYLWLISAWLLLGRWGWLPAKRPPGNGEVARLWDLGGVLGKTVVLTAVTFVAYLIGSFLEMDPDGPIARDLAPVALVNRRPPYARWLSWSWSQLGGVGLDVRYRSRIVAKSFSREARRDLVQLLERRNGISDAARLSVTDARIVGRKRGVFERLPTNERARIKIEIAADQIIYQIIGEMPQLASKLLAKNKDLYGKYDRHMAQAAVRLNISVPLTVLCIVATWQSHLNVVLQEELTLLALTFGLMLFRQGLLRTVSARDVIAQALAIDQVESSYIPAKKKPAESPEGHPAESREPEAPDEEVKQIQPGGRPDAEGEKRT